MSAWSWPGTKILRIIDGDTVDVLVSRDLGFGGQATYPIRLRLNRINAPKVTSKAGRAARDRVAALLPVDSVVDMETIRPYKYGGPEDQRGEYMAEIKLGDGRNLSDVLVSEGLAVPWDGQGARPDDSGK